MDAGAKARTVYVTPRKWPEKRRSDNKDISNAEKAKQSETHKGFLLDYATVYKKNKQTMRH